MKDAFADYPPLEVIGSQHIPALKRLLISTANQMRKNGRPVNVGKFIEYTEKSITKGQILGLAILTQDQPQCAIWVDYPVEGSGFIWGYMPQTLWIDPLNKQTNSRKTLLNNDAIIPYFISELLHINAFRSGAIVHLGKCFDAKTSLLLEQHLCHQGLDSNARQQLFLDLSAFDYKPEEKQAVHLIDFEQPATKQELESLALISIEAHEQANDLPFNRDYKDFEKSVQRCRRLLVESNSGIIPQASFKLIRHCSNKTENALIGGIFCIEEKTGIKNLRRAYISDVFLKTQYQGQGFGQWMLYQSLTQLKALGFEQVTLDVTTHNKAKQLYLKFGFQVVEDFMQFFCPDTQ